MREYVQAEVKLAVTLAQNGGGAQSTLEPLREQVTRFETEVRRLIDVTTSPYIEHRLSDEQLRAINNLIPYGIKPRTDEREGK